VVAPRYRLLAGDLGTTVWGASPPNKPTRGRVFLLAGAAKFIRPPPAFFGSLGVSAQKWVRRRKLAISLKLNLLASHHCDDFTVWGLAIFSKLNPHPRKSSQPKSKVKSQIKSQIKKRYDLRLLIAVTVGE